MLPDPVYWILLGCGVVGIVLGGIAMATVLRRPSAWIATPALLGIALNVALAYFALGFAVFGFGGDPRWGQIFPQQGPPPAERPVHPR